MTARYPGTCTCGASFEAGDEIRWNGECVVGCEDCAFSGQARKVADLSCVRGGGRGLAAALRRRHEREARRRARETS